MIHPDRRAEHAAATIMAAPFLGIDHRERTMLALMIRARFNGSLKQDDTVPVNILSDEDMEYSVRVGYAHRLAASLRTPLYDTDSGFVLKRDADRIELHVEERVADLVVETALKDLERMASVFDAEAEIVSTAAR
jgi:exopolyphosphatase/pppGpp-phosphohydrolase